MSSEHGALFAGLPAPELDRLTVYVFGPGFGESQVVALPDGKWMVIDSCELSGVCLPLELLRHFKVPAIDLLAVTHPDLDHYRGLTSIIATTEVKHFWRYPGFHTPRDILIDLAKLEPENGEFAEMRAMHEAMGSLMRTGRSHEACYGFNWWPKTSPYRVTCIAPCDAEKNAQTKALGKLFKKVSEKKALTHEEKRRLMGKANGLSLALVLWWGRIGVLFGGDVERGNSGEGRGWSGILRNMEEDEDLIGCGLDLIRGLRLVKLAHHGSEGALSEDAWKYHAADGPIDLAVAAPFGGGRNPPPQVSSLGELRRFARRLAVTSPPSGAWSRVTDAGWLRVEQASGPGAASCVAISLDATPPSVVALSSQGALFALDAQSSA